MREGGVRLPTLGFDLCPCTAKVLHGNSRITAVEGAGKGAEMAQTGDNSLRAKTTMIVILHPLPCQMIAEATKADLLAAFAGHVEVVGVNAEPAAAWPGSSLAWDDLLIVIFDGSPFPDAGIRFISEYQNQRGEDAMVLPVAIDPASQKPPKPAEGIKALLYDKTAAGESGRLVNRTGGMLGLRVQGRNTKIFVSYRGVDGSEIAQQVNSHLRTLGHRTFLDQAKEFDGEPTILPGNPVQKEIDDALDTANLILLIDTPRAPESPWIKHEIDTADGLLLPILPICFRDSTDRKKGTRFRELLALQRWIMLPTPSAGAAPLSSAQLDQIVDEAETYLCEIFRRKCRVPFIVKKEFVSRGFAWAVLNQKLLMFTSSKTGGRLTTKILNHCSIFDEIYEPAIRRFHVFLSEAGHVNHSLFIYDGELLPNHEVLELAKESPDSVVILHHQELAALIDSHFTMLGAA
jgi:hypothetical protein